MSTLGDSVSGLGAIGSMVWIGHLIHLVRHRREAVSLAGLGEVEPGGGWPGVAMIFAARDEAGAVGSAARSMLAQDYPALEVIAVDDRSADATGAILDAIAREQPRLRVVHVVGLPAGWLGKTHALQEGSTATEAPWLLFTDADVVFHPGAVRKAIAFAESEALDHLTVAPGVPTESAGERMFLTAFSLFFSLHAPIGRIDDRSNRAHVGIGAFNLVRAEAFDAIGGFRRIALSVDDDMRLAQALKFAGYRNKLLLGEGAISVRWQIGLGGMVRGLEKNFFAGLGFNPIRVAVVASGLVALGIAPYAGLLVGPWWARVACGLGVASIAAIVAAGSRQSQIGVAHAATVPIATLAMLWSLARSVALTLARGGVRWRGHLYPIGQLKAHVRHRDAWAREVWRSTR